jgi:hypothetical protein
MACGTQFSVDGARCSTKWSSFRELAIVTGRTAAFKYPSHLVSFASPPSVSAITGSLAPAATSASQNNLSQSERAESISVLRLALWAKNPSLSLAEREICSLKQKLAIQSRLSESISEAAEVLGKQNLNILLSAIGPGRSSQVVFLPTIRAMLAL